MATERDLLATEEPLEIRLIAQAANRQQRQSVSITMRTPGDDLELAVGFLFNEGILRGADDLDDFPVITGQSDCNTIDVRLRPGLQFDSRRLLRHFYTTSSCGVCGKASLEALRLRGCPALPPHWPVVLASTVRELPEKLRRSQSVFERTGGLHAAALFDAAGQMMCVREDVGRHNAVDKVIGSQLLAGRLPLSEALLMVSGRTSFEIVQKALAARVPVVAAVSAPSSLAVSLAEEFRITLLGFVRGDTFNIYSGAQRIAR